MSSTIKYSRIVPQLMAKGAKYTMVIANSPNVNRNYLNTEGTLLLTDGAVNKLLGDTLKEREDCHCVGDFDSIKSRLPDWIHQHKIKDQDSNDMEKALLTLIKLRGGKDFETLPGEDPLAKVSKRVEDTYDFVRERVVVNGVTGSRFDHQM